MIQFEKPTNLNGAELLAELREAGVDISENQYPVIDGNGDFYLNVKATDKAKAEIVVAAHNGTTVASVPSVEDKLASVGLNVADLKSALGL
jgi:hypothetical protein